MEQMEAKIEALRQQMAKMWAMMVQVVTQFQNQQNPNLPHGRLPNPHNQYLLDPLNQTLPAQLNPEVKLNPLVA